MVAAVQAASRSAGAADAAPRDAAMDIAPDCAAQPHRAGAGWGDQGAAAGMLLAVAVSLPLWVLLAVLARMIIA